MTVATWALGSLLQRKNPTTLTYQTVSGCRDITGPSERRDIIEITNHSSPGGREEFIGGIKRTGTVATKLIYDPSDAVHQSLRSDYDSGVIRDWKIVLPDVGAAEISFQAFVETFGFMEAINAPLEIDFSLKITGDVTIAY